jgi:hypothetical protein
MTMRSTLIILAGLFATTFAISACARNDPGYSHTGNTIISGIRVMAPAVIGAGGNFVTYSGARHTRQTRCIFGLISYGVTTGTIVPVAQSEGNIFS